MMKVKLIKLSLTGSSLEYLSLIDINLVDICRYEVWSVKKTSFMDQITGYRPVSIEKSLAEASLTSISRTEVS